MVERIGAGFMAAAITGAAVMLADKSVSELMAVLKTRGPTLANAFSAFLREIQRSWE